MAVVKMKKITLVAHKKDRRKILRVLARLGTVETAVSGLYGNAECGDASGQREELEKKIGRLNFAFAFLKDIKNTLEKNQKKLPEKERKQYKFNLKKENRVIGYDELTEIVKEEYDLFSEIDTMEEVNSNLTDIKAELTRLKNLRTQIMDYYGLDIKFSEIHSTENAEILVGVAINPPEDLASLFPTGTVCETSANDKNVCISLVYHKSDADDVKKVLSTLDFQHCPFDFDETPKQVLTRINDTEAELLQKRAALYDASANLLRHFEGIKLLYDYYAIENAKLDVIEMNKETGRAFVLEGWVPDVCAELTRKSLTSACPSVEIVISEPAENDMPPSFVKNSPLVAPFGENITGSFGHPVYGSMDPNPFVAFFYFLIFGFMLSDAGYGIIMTAACFLYLLIKKPVKNSGSFILMFGICGISTVIWGAIFGGWFGIEASIMEQNAFGRFLLSLKLVDPLNGSQTLIMFGMALAIGVIQIATGFFLNGYQKLKKAPLDGIFNDFSWVIIFLGAGVYLLDMVVKTSIVGKIGIALVIVGVVMLIVGGAIGKKNPLKMAMGSFKNLYGAVNVFSDILSYSRLFGLGLTTGVIALVVNKMGNIFLELLPFGLGYLPAIVVWVGGHLFNIAINTLGVYVHNSRLQYVEFFGKFYEGGGHAFNPLGSKTKYIYLSDSLTAKQK